MQFRFLSFVSMLMFDSKRNRCCKTLQVYGRLISSSRLIKFNFVTNALKIGKSRYLSFRYLANIWDNKREMNSDFISTKFLFLFPCRWKRFLEGSDQKQCSNSRWSQKECLHQRSQSTTATSSNRVWAQAEMIHWQLFHSISFKPRDYLCKEINVELYRK